MGLGFLPNFSNYPKDNGVLISLETQLRLITAALFINAISGCAARTWSHPTKSSQQFHADKAECSSMSGAGSSSQIMPTYGQPGFNTGFNQGFNQTQAIGASMAKGQIYEDCMLGKGWQQTETSTATAPPNTSYSPSPSSASHADYDPREERRTMAQNMGFRFGPQYSEETGNEIYINNGTVKPVGDKLSIESVVIYKKPSPTMCRGKNISAYMLQLTCLLDEKAKKFKPIALRTYDADNAICDDEVVGVGYQAIPPNSPWDRWITDHRKYESGT